MCLQKFLPGLEIFWNLPLDSYLSFLHVLAEIPPPPEFADFLKSATGQLPRLPSWNIPLDSYLSYPHVLTEIPSLSLQIFWNLPLNQLPKLADMCIARNFPPCFHIFWNLVLDSYLS